MSISRGVRFAFGNGAVLLAAVVLSAADVPAAAPAAPSDKDSEICAPTAVKPQPESTRKMVERLAGISRDVDPRAVMLFAGKTADYLKRKVAESTNPIDKTFLQFSYATSLLNDGRTEEALQAVATFERWVAENGIRPKPGDASKITLFKAICYLRLGEQQNCLTNHNSDSCLLPIRGGGVHRDQTGSREAVKYLKQVLDTEPTTYAAWLYNIAYMTLGEYPDGVPEQWRIPPEVFQSDYDIKRFPDVAGILGVDVDDLSGGVVMDDFDNDGFLDVMVSATSLESQLRYFHNNGAGSKAGGDGTFTELTDAAGLTGLTSGLNMVQGDYNNDGLIDVLVLRGAWLGAAGRYPHSLLRNNGDNTFTDVTEEAGVLGFHPTQTAAWFDYDGDGWLDIFIGNESVPGTNEFDACELYHNNRDGTFTECAAPSGVAVTQWVKAVVAGDFNNDGRPDLYLSVFGGQNILLRNDGPAAGDKSAGTHWQFTNVAFAAGVTEPIKSFPAWFFDYDNDGWLDLFVSGYAITNAGDILADYLGADLPPSTERARLYHNNGDGTFRDVTRQMGLYKVLQSMGSNFGDLDNDGWLDFYLGTGDPHLGTLIPNRMFRNAEGRGFQDVTTSGGFGQLQKGHGVAFGDMNNDGEEDIYSVVGGAFAGDHYPNQLFANPGHGNHWLKLKLEGVQSNRPAIGARIKVVVKTATGERSIHRVVGSGGSFGCSPLRQEIGLGKASGIARVEVFWPATGRTQTIENLQLDHSYGIREGDATARELALKSFAWPSPTNAPAHHHHSMAAPAK